MLAYHTDIIEFLIYSLILVHDLLGQPSYASFFSISTILKKFMTAGSKMSQIAAILIIENILNLISDLNFRYVLTFLLLCSSKSSKKIDCKGFLGSV